MKKFLAILLVFILTLGLAACGSDDSKESKDGSVDVDKNILTVDITFPASFFGEDGIMADFDPDTYVAENGFEKAVVNDDGSVTVTMTKSKHKELMDEMTASIDETFDEMISDEDAPYIEKITPSKDYSSVEVLVDRNGYDSAWFDMTPFAIGLQVMFYQVFAGDDLHCEVTMKYSDNNEVISTSIYPDSMESDE